MLRKIGFAIAVAGLVATGAMAQDATRFGDKLGFMPVSNTNRPLIGGTGEVEATLDGSTLTISGKYSGLRGDAKALAVHSAPPGQAGPEIAAFDLAGGKEGEINGSIDLNDDQVKLLQSNNLYVVVKTSRNDKGELRAWLMSKTEN